MKILGNIKESKSWVFILKNECIRVYSSDRGYALLLFTESGYKEADIISSFVIHKKDLTKVLMKKHNKIRG